MTTYTVFHITPNCIETQTPKAILINGMGWFPKSQIRWLSNGNDMTYCIIPDWLRRSSYVSLWDIDGHQIGWVGRSEDEWEHLKDITNDVHNTKPVEVNNDGIANWLINVRKFYGIS